MTIETKELKLSEELKRKIEMVCRFAYVDYSIQNGNIKSKEMQDIMKEQQHIYLLTN